MSVPVLNKYTHRFSNNKFFKLTIIIAVVTYKNKEWIHTVVNSIYFCLTKNYEISTTQKIPYSQFKGSSKQIQNYYAI